MSFSPALTGELFVLIGGVENGDLDLLEKHSGTPFQVEWSVLKSVQPGDKALIYIRHPHGSFVASAEFVTAARKGNKGEWAYLATIANIQRTTSTPTLAELKKRFPHWRWLNYPRSFCHVPQEHARSLWRLCTAPQRQKRSERPTVTEYISGFRKIRSSISARQQAILRAHYLAPNHTATSGELAIAAGHESFSTVNAHYGRLGRMLREALGRPMRNREQQSSILASFEAPDGSSPHWRWHMNHEVAGALASLGWFDDEQLGDDLLSVDDPSSERATENVRTVQLRTHRSRERSLAQAKIASVLAANAGRLRCEVPGCGFDFGSKYGALGEGFAEVHHLTPLAEVDGPVETTLADLAVVCANCHRMIHRGNSCRCLAELLAD